MRTNVMKFAAIVLAAVLLLTAAISGLGIIYLTEYDLYRKTPAEALDSFLGTVTWEMAYYQAALHLAKQYGNLQEEEEWLLNVPSIPLGVENRVIGIEQPVIVSQNEKSSVENAGDVIAISYVIRGVEYPCVWKDGQTPVEGIGEPLYMERRHLQVNNKIEVYNMQYYYFDQEPILVTVLLRAEENPWQNAANLAYSLRNYLPMTCVSALVLCMVCMVYLCWVGGRKKGTEEILPGGLNRLPLDLYALVDCVAGFFLLMLLFEGVPALIAEGWDYPAMIFAFFAMFMICLICVCYIFCFATQVKADGFWWRRSVIGWCCLHILRVLRWCWRGMKAVFEMLPVIWQWLLTAAGMVLAVTVTTVMTFEAHYYVSVDDFWLLLLVGALLLCVVMVCYGGWCFGTILKAAKGMAAGDLDRKIDAGHLYSSFRDCAENLNTVSQAAMVAARKQMQSERMKTELITNVSHDIKTPLTSIINYVDLLQKPHTEEENSEYLEVLARQSQRLKKLTEDLVEMSKATTGNVTAELIAIDAVEAALQALGEFGDKLEAVPLSVMFPQPQSPVLMRADGRLTWRVLNNLLGNVVKYAMPGTRLYVNIEETAGWVYISFKNISQESLNISAEELMERFVRGDASRNTEGSGLGLNIAQGLMEAQGGKMKLTVDGDLFKVTLSFPVA